MPDIKLGPVGSEVTLPKIRWMGTSPNTTIPQNKQIKEAVMSDGSRRYGEFAIKREWTYIWLPLNATDKNILQALHNMAGALHFQNNWESAAWYNVVIVSFVLTPLVDLYGGTDVFYLATMGLKET